MTTYCCPRCGSERIRPNGTRTKTGMKLYRCSACGKQIERRDFHDADSLIRARTIQQTKAGFTPQLYERNENSVVDLGQVLKGKTVNRKFLFDDDGNPILDEDGNQKVHIRQDWVKTKDDPGSVITLMEAVVDGLATPIKGLAPLVPPPSENLDRCMTAYCFGDPHVGLYSWERETGENYSLRHAEEDMKDAMDFLVAEAKPTKEALIFLAGDTFHADNSGNKTERSGHALDVDGRYGKVIEVGVAIVIHMILRALEKHEIVRLDIRPGNHDDHSALWLAICIRMYFHNEPRVIVKDNKSTVDLIRFGKVAIGLTHGHTIKVDRLGAKMATDYAKDWGECEFRYWFTGHRHQEEKKEVDGTIVYTFRTLVAKDKHSAESYTTTGRDCKMITLDREFGIVGEIPMPIQKIRWLRSVREERKAA